MRRPFFLGPVLLSLAAVSAASIRTRDQSDGCGKSVPDDITLGISKNLTITSDSGSTPRKYRIHVPTSYNDSVAVPLILSYHGRGKDMKSQEALSQFSNATYGFEGIAVYPEGVATSSGTKQWQGDPDAPASISDVTFTLELIEEISSAYCINPSRIYAAGKSNGGGFTGLLACDSKATTKIAAFAPVSGALYLNTTTQQLPPCHPTSTRSLIPILEFHGLKDTTIPYDGGLNTRGNANSTNIPHWVNAWATRDGFQVDANVTTELCSEAKRVKKFNWQDTVVHYRFSNLAHDWPSTFANGDGEVTTCADADATRVILYWFGKWSL